MREHVDDDRALYQQRRSRCRTPWGDYNLRHEHDFASQQVS